MPLEAPVTMATLPVSFLVIAGMAYSSRFVVGNLQHSSRWLKRGECQDQRVLRSLLQVARDEGVADEVCKAERGRSVPCRWRSRRPFGTCRNQGTQRWPVPIVQTG